jgi:uncharacterized paraquat-inducible protein A
MMGRRSRSYRCAVCQWQGTLQPIDPGDAAPCPQCGVYLYPLSWGQTWGFALLLIVLSVGGVLLFIVLRR